ncbi:hypothetical protein Glove_120g118 [Diversispora epigaea]|uniref:Ribosome biogenesis protein SLX9 n=1 Tax=Diversispora epigaea TaxID=1348612 RepID=A0A397J607_9GLOM|nr:hypothetical protein Glove_120g118 [Diversispora epigaea]
MPKVKKPRNSIHHRKFAVPEKKVEKVIVGSTQPLYDNNNDDDNDIDKGGDESIIKQQQPQKSQPSQKSHPQTKKEKINRKREFWKQKFALSKLSNLSNNVNKKKRKKKKSQQMDIFEDTLNLSSLKDSLLTINPSKNDQNSQKKSSLNSPPPPPPVVKTTTARKNVAMKEIPRFYEILQHSEFKINPLSTIRTHIENTLEKKKKETMDVD